MSFARFSRLCAESIFLADLAETEAGLVHTLAYALAEFIDNSISATKCARFGACVLQVS